MSKQKLRALIRECLDETLVLKRHNDQIAVTSDLPNRKEQSQETFSNKNKLKAAGFRWDSGINSWTIPSTELSTAMKTINAINKIEAFVETVEDLPELVQGLDNVSKKDELSTKLDGYIKAFGEEVDEKKASDEIRQFMEFQSKLRSRSINNTLLIWIQKRDATHVEGFRTWETKFGRKVRKGATAITILAPRTPRKDKEEEKDDTDVDDEVQRRNHIFFVAVTVFDVKDTDPIPGQEHKYATAPKWHADDTPNETADKIFKYSTQLMSELGISLTRDDSRRGEQGYATADDHINISSNIDGVNKAGTLIHEIAHELLHFKKGSIFHVDQELSSNEKELQAESVSYLVLRHYELPVTHQSTYLALWKADSKAVQKHLGVIKKTTDFIITKLDAIAAEDGDVAPDAQPAA